MKIPSDANVPLEKLTDYLLKERSWDDKSKFLAQAGFDITRPDLLETAIRQLVLEETADEDGENPYGKFFRTSGFLVGPNGKTLKVILVWLQWHADATFHFVTLKPDRSRT